MNITDNRDSSVIFNPTSAQIFLIYGQNPAAADVKQHTSGT